MEKQIMLHTLVQPDQEGRVLIVSLRNLKSHVSRASVYELEDTIGKCDFVDVIEPECNSDFFKASNQLSNDAVRAVGGGRFFKSLPGKTYTLKKDYEIIFFFCQSIKDILVLNSVKDWRKRCKTAICWMDEIWEKDIDAWQNNLSLLNQFDHVFMNFELSLKKLRSLINVPCWPIPYGVDALKFSPMSHPQVLNRSVDLMSVGRRSDITHDALLELTKRRDFFYIYDTIKGLHMRNHSHHRDLYMNFLKRSQFTFVNRAKFDLSGTSNSQEEVGPRFFEGAASGVIMLGEKPNCDAFRQNFAWDDAVIEVPFNCPDIGDVLNHLEAQPERLAAARNNNIVNALLHHDWAYRWEYILNTCNLQVQPLLLERKDRLAALSATVDSWISLPQAC
jgi:hypothetical protein